MSSTKRAARRFSLLYFGVGVVGLVTAGLITDAHLSPAANEGIWAQLAIFVMMSAFLFEPRFTAGATAAANAVAVVFLYLAVEPSRMREWWTLLLAAAAVSLVSNILAYGMASDSSTTTRQRALSSLARRAGGWRGLALPALVLTLATFNTPFEWEWTLGAASALFALAVTTVRPHELWTSLFGTRTSPEDASSILALFPPNEVLVASADDTRFHAGATLRLRSSRGAAEALVTQPTFFGGVRCWRAVAPDLRHALAGPDVKEPLEELELSIQEPTNPNLQRARQEVIERHAECIGVLAEGSRVRSALIELSPGASVSVGEVLWTLRAEGRTYWQVTDAEVRRSTWAGDTRRGLVAEAAQIGRWASEAFAFEVDTASPDPTALLFRGGDEPLMDEVIDIERHTVGHLVGSAFPVVVHLGALSRQHAAILGTTGTGKTHLAFGLAGALANAGVRVICVDQTGQYSSRFPDAAALSNVNDAKAFLDGEASIAVLTPHAANPIVVINALARGLLERFRELGAVDPKALARCVVMIDEAHNFVPETFVINDWDLKAKAQDTSMVLMESRKFGLGFVLISQRTAMVTKSALSQCNSIFAFQAVDQTGLDYLEGLCGRTYATALPTLPHRTAIVMGQALSSNAPVIAYVSEADVVVP